MDQTLDIALRAVFAVTAALWVGGMITVILVERVARDTLSPEQRVAFFRRFGQVYGMVSGGAAVLAMAGGALLLGRQGWDGVATLAAALAVALVLATGWGVRQARRMTRLRDSALTAPEDPELSRAVATGARRAGALRTAIGLLTLALVVALAVAAG